VSPDYFMLMQCPLIRGRFFLESDESGKQEVAHMMRLRRDAIGRASILSAGASGWG